MAKGDRRKVFYLTAQFALLKPADWQSGYFETYEAARDLAERWKEIHEENVWNIKIVFDPYRA